jgi:uncharacterized DUF497 family protein
LRFERDVDLFVAMISLRTDLIGATNKSLSRAGRCATVGGKRRKNLALHGVDFTAVERFAWDFAVVSIDDREDYGELRQRAVGFIGPVPHVLVFTERQDRGGSLIWVISLRKANRRERRDYERARPE